MALDSFVMLGDIPKSKWAGMITEESGDWDKLSSAAQCTGTIHQPQAAGTPLRGELMVKIVRNLSSPSSLRLLFVWVIKVFKMSWNAVESDGFYTKWMRNNWSLKLTSVFTCEVLFLNWVDPPKCFFAVFLPLLKQEVNIKNLSAQIFRPAFKIIKYFKYFDIMKIILKEPYIL